MLRSLRSLSLVLAAAGLLAPAAANAAPAHAGKKAATSASSKKKSAKKKVSYPSVKKVTPLKAGIGDKLSLTGSSFRKGTGKNYVVFKRDGGRALFVKAGKSTAKSISVVIPAKLLTLFTQKGGAPQPTKFRLRVMATRLGTSYTKVGMSPTISPVSGEAAGPADDCDGDGVVNAKDNDDDNDLLSDTTEAQYGTDPCKRDSDGDGMSDGWEVQSAKDRNGGTYPKLKPSPNPLDPKDAQVDSDGDGLTNAEEYTAWATYGGNTIPLSYSGGNATSAGRGPVPPELKYMDRDRNGYLSDFERDADGDGIPNMDEDHGNMQGDVKSLARLTTGQTEFDSNVYDFGIFNTAYLTLAAKQSKMDPLRCAGINQTPFFCVDKSSGGEIGVIDVQKVDTLDWLTPDSDGDGIRDDNDDVDHDGVPNNVEYQQMLGASYASRRLAALDGCVPNIDSPSCLLGDIDGDGLSGAADTDADGDGLSNDLEAQVHTNPIVWDTDGDGVSDGYEYWSAKDLNGSAVPSADKKPWPNALDGTDAKYDFDGDGLLLREEYALWKLVDGHTPISEYSDGQQATGGLIKVTTPTQDNLDIDQDGYLSDDERDADNDLLSNIVEFSFTGTQAWWNGVVWYEPHPLTPPSPTDLPKYSEQPYSIRAFNDLSAVDGDTDGDGIIDGLDDQDNDGWNNQQEMEFGRWRLPSGSQKMYPYRVHPYNPCLPDPNASTCSRYIPQGTKPWPPFDGTQQAGDALPFGWDDSSLDPSVTWDSSMLSDPAQTFTGPWTGSHGVQGP
jgi:hypothetical protein